MIYPPLDCMGAGREKDYACPKQQQPIDMPQRRPSGPTGELDPLLVRPRTGPASCSTAVSSAKSRAFGRATHSSRLPTHQQMPVALSPREQARERKEVAEAEHRRALADAAAQARSDRRRVMAKMRDLERSNAKIHQEVVVHPAGDDSEFMALRIGQECNNMARKTFPAENEVDMADFIDYR